MASPKPLLPHQPYPAAGAPPANPHPVRGGGGGAFCRYPEFGFIPVALNYVACLYRGDNCFDFAYAFTVGLLLCLLFSLVRWSQRAPPRSDARLRLKLAVWAVDTAVIFAGTWWCTRRFDPPMPLRVAAPLWAFSAVCSALVLPMCARRD
ncbi:hypothetical protein PR202_gb17896 [Eleusine coracana subsp. coracana]|uniref:Uncharacterized protein n=1 Tax=Eleusine coracana subsp. coracana TaxID=191504 RepID=A0AAV5F4R7_ELECO|nr:hypothetical protein PR202_gb17896 [Eleusine coracana subsp. coracana]